MDATALPEEQVVEAAQARLAAPVVQGRFS
jgi:hypothetical protein